MKILTLIASLVLAQAFCHLHAATTLIDFTFDNTANDTGNVQQVSNGNGGSSVIATGVATSTGNSASYGFNSTALVSTAGYTGFTVTYVVEGTSANPTASAFNGLFFGIVRSTTNPNGTATGTGGTSLWNNTTAFGYIVGSAAYGNHRMVSNLNSSTRAFDTVASTAPSDASIEDGFTLSFSVFSDNTWSITSTGLDNNLSDTGNLSSLQAGLNYSSFAFIGVNSSIQRGNTGGDVSYNLASVSVVGIPEPSHAALIGLAGLCLLVRRRR